jgi:hypothetical protein
MDDRDTVLYICPVCFRVCETERECHQHRTRECHPGHPGDETRKPVMDQYGHYVSRAPRWFLEAQGIIPAWTPVERKVSA